MTWPATEVRNLIILADQGFSRAEAAVRLGRSEDSVRHRADKLAIRFRRDSYGGLVRPPHSFVTDEYREDMQERSKALVRAVARAMWQGDDVLSGQPKPVRPLILQG